MEIGLKLGKLISIENIIPYPNDSWALAA